jgi:molecular chaperone GrpE (heat shock protein)
MVIAVIREGYAIGDDLLRPASVVVGRYQATGT